MEPFPRNTLWETLIYPITPARNTPILLLLYTEWKMNTTTEAAQLCYNIIIYYCFYSMAARLVEIYFKYNNMVEVNSSSSYPLTCGKLNTCDVWASTIHPLVRKPQNDNNINNWLSFFLSFTIRECLPRYCTYDRLY